MQQPDWAEILSYLHEHNGEMGVAPEGLEGEDAAWETSEDSKSARFDLIRENVSLDDPSSDSIDDALTHLKSNGLLQVHDGREYTGIELTKSGFNVAHERELARQNSRINRSLAAFTLVLVVITAVDVAPLERWVKGVAIALLMVAVLVAADKTRTFDF